MGVVFNWFADKVKAELNRRAQALRDEALQFMLSRYVAYASQDTGHMVSTAEIVRSDSSSKYGGVLLVAAPYAGWVEFGHYSVRGAGGKFVPINPGNFGQAEWFPPNPAMRMAVEDTIGEFPKLADKIKTGRASEGLGGANTVAAGIEK
jgi:hypothetical protein